MTDSYICYHVFDWNQDRDGFFNDLEKAEEYFNQLKKEGCTSIRLYEIEDDEEGLIGEDCIDSYEENNNDFF